MIIYTNTNLFLSPAQTLVNTVNTVGVMGKGIAKEFKKYYPAMYQRYRTLCLNRQFTVGQLQLNKGETIARAGKPEVRKRWVLNFPTKAHWRSPSQMQYVEDGLRRFVETYKQKGIESVSFPQLGVGNGGLSWPAVHAMMRQYLAALDIPVYIHLYSAKDAYGTNPAQAIRRNLNTAHDAFTQLDQTALFAALPQAPRVNVDGVILPAAMEARNAAFEAASADFHGWQPFAVMPTDSAPVTQAFWLNPSVYHDKARATPAPQRSEAVDLFAPADVEVAAPEAPAFYLYQKLPEALAARGVKVSKYKLDKLRKDNAFAVFKLASGRHPLAVDAAEFKKLYNLLA